MKTIYEYIKESLLDDEDEVIDRADKYLKIDDWCKNHLQHKEYSINNGKINVHGPLYFYGIRGALPDYIKFGKVDGECFIDAITCPNRMLKDLSWFPEEVDGYIHFSDTGILSLKNIPLKKAQSILLSEKKLKCLEGLEDVEIDWALELTNCNELENLKGCPKHIKRSIIIKNCKKLKSLEGAPKTLNRDLECTDCASLTSLKGAPEEVMGCCDFSYSGLKSLKGAPKKVGDDFICFRCEKLESLEDAPEEIGGNFVAYGCFSLTDEAIKDFKKKRKNGKYKYRMQIK